MLWMGDKPSTLLELMLSGSVEGNLKNSNRAFCLPQTLGAMEKEEPGLL